MTLNGYAQTQRPCKKHLHPRRPHREGEVLHRHQTPPQRRHLPSIDASLIGADCNCVFDTTIDLDGASAATATNLRKGAAEYLNILTEYSLSTISPMLYARDFLGNNTKLFTNAHTSREEEYNRTRIDHIHAPHRTTPSHLEIHTSGTRLSDVPAHLRP